MSESFEEINLHMEQTGSSIVDVAIKEFGKVGKKERDKIQSNVNKQMNFVKE
jgi:hypothetical protein